MPDPTPEGGSLATRLLVETRARFGALRLPEWRALGPGDWRISAAIALLIAAGPIATIIGAGLLARGARAETARLHAQLDPRIAAAAAVARDRTQLSALLRRPTLSAMIEALARALPSDAALLRAERDRQRLLELDISTPDPDQLRAALRREPMLANLHDTGQRQEAATMVVSLKEAAE